MWLHFALGMSCLCACAEGQEDISRLAHAEVRLHWLSFWLKGWKFYDLASRRTLISEPISTRDTSVSQGFPSHPYPFICRLRFAFGACASSRGRMFDAELDTAPIAPVAAPPVAPQAPESPLASPAPEIAPDPSPSAVSSPSPPSSSEC